MEYVQDDSLWANFLADNGYDLLGRLDNGSFSDVYAVRVRATGKAAAVKRLVARRDIRSDPAVVSELACLTVLNAVRGTCVVRLEGSIILDRLACVFLELAPLGNLENYAATHWPLPSRLVTAATRQLLSALSHCHRLHIAHRDLNPANVLLVAPNVVRLADFGLAVQCRPDSTTGRPAMCSCYLGRKSYLAPEVLKHSPYNPVQADLWSMGCLCIFLATGQHPSPARLSLPGEKKLVDNRPAVQCGADIRQNVYSKKTLAVPCRWKRTSSVGSEGSCRSESDADDGFAPVLPSDSVSNGRDPVSATFDKTVEGVRGLQFHNNNSLLLESSETADVAVFEIQPSDNVGGSNTESIALEFTAAVEGMNLKESSPLIISELKDEQFVLDSALPVLVSKLCVFNPKQRLQAEEALTYWKRQLKHSSCVPED